MYKQSPRRGHRSKGIKLKHILQICLLLAVCFWLAYQVKRSQDKSKELAGKDGTDVDKPLTESEVLRFGRKDLPRVTEIATEEKHEEDDEGKETEEEHSKPEEDDSKSEEFANKHEEEEAEGDEKSEEREVGDNETVENDLDKNEAEHEGEEQVDEDKNTDVTYGDAEQSHTKDEENEDTRKENHDETEENDDAGKDSDSEIEESDDHDNEDDKEKDVLPNDQNHDEDGADTHEAREEHYKGDDASSEVVHNVKSENVTVNNPNDMFGKVNFGQENETITSISADAQKNEGQPLVVIDVVSNGTVVEQKTPENNLTVSDDGSLQNSTSATLLSNLPELNSNYTSLDGEHRALSENAVNRTAHPDPNVLSSVSNEDNKPMLSTDEKNLSVDSVNSSKTEDAYTNAGDSLSSNDTTVTLSQKRDETAITKAANNSFVGDETHSEKSENDDTTGSDETSSSHLDDENEGAVEHDPIDASDTGITDEDKESRIDLDSLPKIETEGQDTDEALAE